jgi:hypothetical protein
MDNAGNFVGEVFDYWVLTHFSGKGRPPVLTTEREKKISWAVKTFGVETTKAAIDGCLRSEWHMGNNPGGKKYNDISLILRNAEKVESFAGIADGETVTVPSTETSNDWIERLVDRAFASWNIDPNKTRRIAAYEAWRAVLNDLSSTECEQAVTYFAVIGTNFMPKPGDIRRRVLRNELTAPLPLEAWVQFQTAQRAVMSGTAGTVLHPCVSATLKKINGGSGLHTNGDREMFIAMYETVVGEFEAEVLGL